MIYFVNKSSNTLNYPPQANHTVVSLNKVSKYFEGSPVLKDISFSVKAGEFLSLVGPSGCGKTTLLGLISGLEEPDQGEILIDHISVKGVGPQTRPVNTVFQSYALFPHLNVFDNVAFGLRCKGFSASEIEQRTLEALQRVKLDGLAFRKPAQLSGGQQQRVAIARAVVNRPRVLLLDEPLSALDYRLRKTMQIELKQLQMQLGIAFILVTHDQEEALSISDRVIVMHEGGILQIGTPRELYEEPCNLKVAEFLGEANILDVNVLNITPQQIHITVEGKQFVVPNRRQFQEGQPLCIMVRPEDLQISKNTDLIDVQSAFEGVVEQVIYKGSTVDLYIRLKSNRLLAATQFFNEDDEELDFQLGGTVWASWIPGWEVVLLNES
jgi:spermidine/putrescine transport system ATP-binding protein